MGFVEVFETDGERRLNEITPIVWESGSAPAISRALHSVYQGLCLCGKSWLMMYSSILAVKLHAQLNVYCAQLREEGELIMKANMEPLSGSRCACACECGCVCAGITVSLLFHHAQAEATTPHSFSNEPFKASKNFQPPSSSSSSKAAVHLRI